MPKSQVKRPVVKAFADRVYSAIIRNSHREVVEVLHCLSRGEAEAIVECEQRWHSDHTVAIRKTAVEHRA